MNTTLTFHPADRRIDRADAESPPGPSSTRPPAPRISPFGASDHAPTTEFEVAFRARLSELGHRVATPTEAPRRTTITALVTALRSAVDPDHVLSVARGLTADDLAVAYDFVDGLRSRAVDALDALADEPTVDVFVGVEPSLARLLPHPTATLRSVADERPTSFRVAVSDVMARIQLLDRAVNELEGRITAGDPEWRQLIVELDDGRSHGVFHQQNYRPQRIGDIMPLRLASLLGETDRDDER